MAAILIPVVLVVIALVAGALTAKRFMAREQARASKLDRGARTTVRYQVPHGQDPAAVLARLHQAGYEAVVDPGVANTGELLIAGREGHRLDREELRGILGGVTQLNMEGDQLPAAPPIRFADE